jgi:hypothetical protein
MFIGHLGVGLALKKADKSINLAWLLSASMLLDLIFWLLVFFEVERVEVPANYITDRYLIHFFPFSHGLAASIFWSLVVYFISLSAFDSKRAATILGLAVFSHFLLDLLVHIKDIPLVGQASPKIGLGLWEHVSTAFLLEILILLGGLIVYFYSAPVRNFSKRMSLFVVMVLVTILGYMNQMRGPIPEYGNQIGVSAFVSILLIIILAYWLDREGSIHDTEPGRRLS